jgi:hypothetical protein
MYVKIFSNADIVIVQSMVTEFLRTVTRHRVDLQYSAAGSSYGVVYSVMAIVYPNE